MSKNKRFIYTTLNEYLNEDEIGIWMTGQCIPFTVALKEIFPEYGIAVLNDQYETDDEDIEYNFNFVHAFCYHPKNFKIIVDAKGIRKLDDIYDEFYDIDPVIDWDIPDSQYLIDNYSGKEFYSEESHEYDIEEYKNAKEYIENNIDLYKINI